MQGQAKSNLTGALIALLAFALFSGHDAVVKYLGGTYAPFQIVFFSVLLSFPLATLMLMGDSTDGTLRPRHPWWTALRTVAAMITGVCAFTAFATLPLAQVYAILFATPLLITVLAIPVLGEVVRLRRWIAVIVGLCGVLIVVRPGMAPMTLGHLAALCAAVGAAIAAIVVRKIGQDERPIVLMLYPMLANVLMMGAALPFVYQPMPGLDLGAQALIALLAFSASLLMILAYTRGEAVVVAPMQYSQIVWAALYGALFFGERIDWQTAGGAAIVIASGLYILLREGRAQSSANRPVLRTRSRPETGTYLRIGPLVRRAEARQAAQDAQDAQMRQRGQTRPGGQAELGGQAGPGEKAE
ncbi:MAG: DMT family transporter [Pseudomonadota bacterium]